MKAKVVKENYADVKAYVKNHTMAENRAYTGLSDTTIRRVKRSKSFKNLKEIVKSDKGRKGSTQIPVTVIKKLNKPLNVGINPYLSSQESFENLKKHFPKKQVQKLELKLRKPWWLKLMFWR